MDLVDLIQEKRFLGQECLAWLWYKSEERGGSVEVPGRGEEAQALRARADAISARSLEAGERHTGQESLTLDL